MWVFKSDTQQIVKAVVVDVVFSGERRFVRVLEDNSELDMPVYVYGVDCFSSREALYAHFLRVFGVASDRYGDDGDEKFAFLRELQDICDYFGRVEIECQNKIKTANEVHKSRYMGELDGISLCRGRLLARLNALKMIREAMNHKQ